MKLDPAYSVVQRLGGVKAVQDATGVYRTRVYGWMNPKGKNGTGGVIPQRHHVRLLDYARSKDISLTAEDFLPSEHQQAAE